VLLVSNNISALISLPFNRSSGISLPAIRRGNEPKEENSNLRIAVVRFLLNTKKRLAVMQTAFIPPAAVPIHLQVNESVKKRRSTLL